MDTYKLVKREAFGKDCIYYECIHCDYVYVTIANHALTGDDRLALEYHAQTHSQSTVSSKLVASDYLMESLGKLVRRPDYSSKALDVTMRFLLLTTEELEALDDVIGGK